MTNNSQPFIKPSLHHVTLKTTRLQDMIDWYGKTVGTRVIYQFPGGAWLSNDNANHRLGLLAFPDFHEVGKQEKHTGMHHSAFEYGTFEDLLNSYARIRDSNIVPKFCLNHGMTISMYYADPDGNLVELQSDNFGDWSKSADYMSSSPVFAGNPIGVFFDPDRVLAALRAGQTPKSIQDGIMAEKYLPDVIPTV
jgi:catechol 2,3-dioxygenase